MKLKVVREFFDQHLAGLEPRLEPEQAVRRILNTEPKARKLLEEINRAGARLIPKLPEVGPAGEYIRNLDEAELSIQEARAFLQKIDTLVMDLAIVDNPHH
jgi:hypothetical protein